MANVLVNENSLSAIADAIRQKAGTDDTYKPAEMAQAIADIPTGGGEEPERKDVNLYDYDGKRLFSFTFEELNELENLPNPPAAPDGLISAGWNWTINQLKAWGGRANVGHMVFAPPGKAIMRVHISTRKTITLGITGSGFSCSIDWGDGSDATTVTSAQNVSHEFQVGDYSVVATYIISASGAISFSPCYDTAANCDGSLVEAYFERGAIVQLMGRFALKYVSATSGGYYTGDAELRSLVWNGGVSAGISQTSVKHPCVAPGGTVTGYKTSGAIDIYSQEFGTTTSQTETATPTDDVFVGGSVPQYMFNSSSYLRRVVFSAGVTSIPAQSFKGCRGLRYIEFPSTLTAIGASSFACETYLPGRPTTVRFLGTTPPAISGSDFLQAQAPEKIVVPAGTLAAYKSATNLAQYADIIEEAPE